MYENYQYQKPRLPYSTLLRAPPAPSSSYSIRLEFNANEERGGKGKEFDTHNSRVREMREHAARPVRRRNFYIYIKKCKLMKYRKSVILVKIINSTSVSTAPPAVAK